MEETGGTPGATSEQGSSEPSSEQGGRDIGKASLGDNNPKDTTPHDLDHPRVMFDLETTGLGAACHITQIAAVRPDGATFSRYVRPKIPIEPGASRVTGLTLNSGEMCLNGETVDCTSITTALIDFMDFLGDEPVILVGHNIKQFDCPRLLRAAENCHLEKKLYDHVIGFIDTLLMFRKTYPELKSYKQEALYKHFIGGDYDAHNALGDVIALQELLKRAAPDDCHQLPFYFDAKFVTFIESWRPLVTGGYATRLIAEKAATNGIGPQKLTEEYEAHGAEGIENILAEDTHTAQHCANDNETVINKIMAYFKGT